MLGILSKELKAELAAYLLRGQQIVECTDCGKPSWWNLKKRMEQKRFIIQCHVCGNEMDIRYLPDWGQDVGVL